MKMIYDNLIEEFVARCWFFVCVDYLINCDCFIVVVLCVCNECKIYFYYSIVIVVNLFCLC